MRKFLTHPSPPRPGISPLRPPGMFSIRKHLAILATLALAAAALFPGCAVIEKDNRHLTKAVGETLVPEGATLKVVTSPVWVTAGIVTLAADGLILNPVYKAPDALDDSLTWSFMGFATFWPAEIVLIVPRAVAVPVIFVGSEIARCSIPYLF